MHKNKKFWIIYGILLLFGDIFYFHLNLWRDWRLKRWLKTLNHVSHKICCPFRCIRCIHLNRWVLTARDTKKITKLSCSSSTHTARRVRRSESSHRLEAKYLNSISLYLISTALRLKHLKCLSVAANTTTERIFFTGRRMYHVQRTIFAHQLLGFWSGRTFR